MDRTISIGEQRKGNSSRWLKILVVITLLVAAFFGLRKLLTTTVKQKDFVKATVERGVVENTISASGLVLPSFEQQINAPISTEIKNVILKSGTEVKKGDLIMDLNQAYIRLEFESLNDQLELRKNNITRLKLEYDKNLRELDFNAQIKTLEVSSLKSALEDVKYLESFGGATLQEVKKAELALQISELEKKKLDNELEFKKAVITSDRRNLELEVMMQEKKIAELTNKLNETSVKASRHGVITWVNESIGKKVAEGEPLVRIANLDGFRVEASCSDRYSKVVKTGMPVRVRINDTNLEGIVSSILPTIENNTIEFVVTLNENNHAALRSNMRVEVFLISNRKEDVLRLKNGPGINGAINQEVFVVKGKEAVRKNINLGVTNASYVEISGGDLKEGDQVIISDMKAYERLDRVELEK